MNRNDYLNPIESVPGYYDIPGYRNYTISKQGQVLNKKTGKLVTQQKNKRNYLSCMLPINENANPLVFRQKYIHRLMGHTFLYPGDEYINNTRDLQINHKDTNMTNNNLDNLEWCTPSENVQHAVAMLHTPVAVSIEARNVNTGKVYTFPSKMACARFFHLNKDQIQHRLNIGPTRVFPEMIQYRRDNFDKPWPEVSNPEFESLKFGNVKPVLLKEITRDNKVSEFPKLQDLAKYLGIAPSTISQWINQPDQPVFPGCIQIKYKSDPTPWRKVEDPYLELAQGGIYKVIQVIDTKTNKKYVYMSAIACAKARKLLPTTLNWRLKSNGTKVYDDGCRYGYYPFD